MRPFILLAGLIMTAVGALPAAQAQTDGTVYLVTYFEVKPPAKKDAAVLLKDLRDAARKGDGNLHAEVVEHVSRPGQFVLLTNWKDQKALDAHLAAAPTKDLRGKLQELRNSPADDRVHNALTLGKANSDRNARRAVYAVTHVDVPPPRKDECIALLNKLAEASRKDDGNVRFDIVQQTNRPNHFTVVEVWKSKKAFDTHGMSAHAREFRDKLTPMSGALYDERLYRALN
jgi:quinol monooxygenase YgiN